MALRIIIFALVFFMAPFQSHAQRPFEQRGITMLQTEEVFFGRVAGMGAFEVYVKEVVDAVDRSVGKLPTSEPSSGFLVVAVQPGGRSRVWLDVTPQLTDAAATSITAAVQNVYPLIVKNGVVLFAIKLSLWGGESPKGMVPRPKEWEGEADKAGGEIELGELVLRVWPD